MNQASRVARDTFSISTRCRESATTRSTPVSSSLRRHATMTAAAPRSTRPSLLGTFSRHSVHHRFARPSKRCLQQLPGRLHVRQRPPAGQAALWIVLSREPGQLRFHLEFLLGPGLATTVAHICCCPVVAPLSEPLLASLSPPVLFVRGLFVVVLFVVMFVVVLFVGVLFVVVVRVLCALFLRPQPLRLRGMD